MADFYGQTTSIDEKIKNSLSSTSLAFQQTFLSKSMPDLQDIKPPKKQDLSSGDGNGFNLPEIAPEIGGIIDAQSQMELKSRRKSFGDLNDIKFFNSESDAGGDPVYGHQAEFQPELHEGVNRLLIKKRSILNEITVPQLTDPYTRKDIKHYYNNERESEMDSKRNSNLKELTSLMVKQSPRKLTIAEEYQKFQIESKMENDIRRAQSIFNSTHQERIEACQTNRDGMDSLNSARKNLEEAKTAESRLEPIDVDALINNRSSGSRNLEEENNKLLQLLKNDRQPESEPSILGFTKTYEPEDQIKQYSNREHKEESPAPSPESREEKQNGDGKPYYPIKMYVKQPKQKDRVGKKGGKNENKENKKNGGSSYADLANNKRSTAKKQPSNINKTKKTKRKVQSAGVEGKPKTNNKSKIGETRDEVKSALESTGPFCKCSDEEEQEEAIDAKHTLDYPIVRPVFNGNYLFDAEQPQYYQAPEGPQATFMAPQQLSKGGFFIPQQAQYQDMVPARGMVNGNLYFNGADNHHQQPPPAAANMNFTIPSMSDQNNNRYDDCPMANKYFNKFAAVQTFQSEYLQEIKNQQKPPVMPKLPVGLHNPSIEMMHTPVESGVYTTTAQEFLPPVPGHQVPYNAKQERFVANNEYTRMSSPQNTSSGYSTDEGYGERQQTKPKHRITKSFSQNSAEEIQDEIIRKNKAMRQKQYSETIRQHQKSTSPKQQVRSWNLGSRDDTENSYNDSKRAAALQYAKNIQQQSEPPRTAPIPPRSDIKPAKTTTTPSDYDQLLKSIEEMKQRHELDKAAVDQLTAGRPHKK